MNDVFKDLDITNLPFKCEFEEFEICVMMRTAYQNITIAEDKNDFIELPTLKITHIPSQKGLYLYSKEIKTNNQMIDLIQDAIEYFRKQEN